MLEQIVIGLIASCLGFIIPAGIHHIIMIETIKRKGFYNMGKYRYSRVKKDNA